jgi:hypothetical protein
MAGQQLFLQSKTFSHKSASIGADCSLRNRRRSSAEEPPACVSIARKCAGSDALLESFFNRVKTFLWHFLNHRRLFLPNYGFLHGQRF